MTDDDGFVQRAVSLEARMAAYICDMRLVNLIGF